MDTLMSKKPPQEGSSNRGRKSASTHKALITRNLRLAYGEVASEPLPDRFLDILGRLDEMEGK